MQRIAITRCCREDLVAHLTQMMVRDGVSVLRAHLKWRWDHSICSIHLNRSFIVVRFDAAIELLKQVGQGVRHTGTRVTTRVVPFATPAVASAWSSAWLPPSRLAHSRATSTCTPTLQFFYVAENPSATPPLWDAASTHTHSVSHYLLRSHASGG